MTCIVGVVESGAVHIGGDSAGVSGWDLTVRSDPKVFILGSFLIGFTTSFRMGQLLRFGFAPPERPEDMPIDRYMATLFVDAVRACLKDGGLAKVENGVEAGGEFLVGHRGRLFYIGSDFQVGEYASGYIAVGVGDGIAHGALHATQGMDPKARVLAALAAAEAHNIGVRGPFTVEVMRGVA